MGLGEDCEMKGFEANALFVLDEAMGWASLSGWFWEQMGRGGNAANNTDFRRLSQFLQRGKVVEACNYQNTT